MAITVGTRRALLIPARSAAAYAGDPDAGAYFARMAVQEPSAFQNLVDAFYVGLKADGAYTPLDRFALLCTKESANALYDLRNVTKDYALFGTTTFTTERGIAGNGVDGYVSFKEALNAAGNSYSQNAAAVGAWCNASLDDGTASHPHFGSVDSGATRLNARIGSENGRINSASTDTSIRVGVARKGFRWGIRADSANVTYGFDATPLAPVAKASTAPTTGHATFGRVDTAYTADRIAAGFSGSLTSAQVVSLYGRLSTLLTGLGAN